MALDSFRKMLTLGNENAVRGYQEIIDTYREAKQWQQATDTAKEALQKLPNDRGLIRFDTMSRFVADELSRHFVVRHNYDAYEYTVYVYRSPSTS